MMKAYKVELKLTKEQKQKVKQDIGNVRKVYNLYLNYVFGDKENKPEKLNFISGFDFSKKLNHEIINDHEYLRLTSSKAIKQSIMNCDKAFKSWKKNKYKAGKPKFKSRTSKVGVYLPKNSPKGIVVERHKIKVPTYGWLRLKEFGYIPLRGEYKSVTLTRTVDDRYFCSVLVNVEMKDVVHREHSSGIGIDLGIKMFVTTSDNQCFENINKTVNIKRIKKHLKFYNRKLSKKKYGSNNYYKLLKKKNALDKRLSNKRKEYYKSVANILVKAKPEFIALENLSVKDMLKNKGLADKISEMNFYNFRLYLEQKAKENNIAIRYVDRYFPSSKTCSCCGSVKDKIKLSERVFKCDCGFEIDRDLNAAINIKNFAV